MTTATVMTCDGKAKGCKKRVEVEDMSLFSLPDGWVRLNAYQRGSTTFPEKHACSLECLVSVWRKEADDLESKIVGHSPPPPTKGSSIPSGGPYR